MTRRAATNRSDEGAALILALCLILVASVLGAAMMMLSQTETYASLNYRSMTQARYAAESGVHKAINYILNTYPQPGSAADPLANYNLTVSPVTYNGQPVVLSGIAGVASNYPVAATADAFNAAAQGNLTLGGTSAGFSASATLLSMKQMVGYGTGTPTIVQTWLITGDGTTGGARPATVEVTAVLEQQTQAFNIYGMFATANVCGALSFGGGVLTDSYDSSNMTMSGGANSHPVTQAISGNVGTNGNLTEGGGSIVNGSLSTPRTGVGHCANGAVDALTQNGNNTSVTGGMVALPQAVSFTPPALPNPLPPTGNDNVTGSTTCAGAGFSAANCSGPAGNLVLNANGGHLSAPDLKLTGGAVLHLTAGNYDFNSISLAGGSQVIVDSGPVVMNIVGTGKTNPIDFSGGSVSNPSFIPKNLQILYAGTAGVQISGGASTAVMVYAPNAAVSLVGGSGIYGSVMGATINDNGGTAVHYDRDLPTEFFTSWNSMLSAFSWKKY
jgi:Tfp pilus assembly protein PilX